MANANSNNPKQHLQGRYWLLTIKEVDWQPPTTLHTDIAYLKGQLEEGAGGFRHWQVLCATKKKIRLGGLKKLFCKSVHAELTRSDAADEYVWKDETCVDKALRFEIGKKALKRNSAEDWDEILELAKRNKIDEIPADIQIRYDTALHKIAARNIKPKNCKKEIFVFWGVSGSGKSHLARQLAGENPYIKDPNTKWWDGYKPEEHTAVIIEEFTGKIDISHFNRWFDFWSSDVEYKGGRAPFQAAKIYITSNVNPVDWYKDINDAQKQALLRRCKIREFKEVYKPPVPPPPHNDNAEFWANAPQHEGIPIGDIMNVPIWRDYLGDLLDDEPGQSSRVPGYFYAEED